MHRQTLSEAAKQAVTERQAVLSVRRPAADRTEQKANRTESPENADMLIGAGACGTTC